MRSPHRKTISLLMLIVSFVMSISAYGFNSRWLAHEFDHNRQMLDVLTDHDHAPQLDAEGNADPEAPSDSEHQLLHAAGHFQPHLISAILNGFGEAPVRTTPMLSRLLALPPEEIEPPFRPPKTTSRI